MDELELSMAQKNDEIEQANKDLASAQQKFNSQQDDMKLRIKYMYEDQSTSLSEVFLSSKNMRPATFPSATIFVFRLLPYRSK